MMTTLLPTTLALALAAPATLPAPPSLEAIDAAPGNHRVLLENDRVRVLQVDVAPGEVEPVHEHRRPGVLIIQSPQPAVDISYALRDGTLVETGRRTLPGGPPPPALWVPAQQPHAIHNLGTGPFRLIRVEYKDTPANP